MPNSTHWLLVENHLALAWRYLDPKVAPGSYPLLIALSRSCGSREAVPDPLSGFARFRGPGILLCSALGLLTYPSGPFFLCLECVCLLIRTRSGVGAGTQEFVKTEPHPYLRKLCLVMQTRGNTRIFRSPGPEAPSMCLAPACCWTCTDANSLPGSYLLLFTFLPYIPKVFFARC